MKGFGGMLTFEIRAGPGGAEVPEIGEGLRLRRVAGRRGEPHRAPGDHDPRLGPRDPGRRWASPTASSGLSVGIEDPQDLIDDLTQAFTRGLTPFP